MTESSHAQLSCSGADRWSECFASVYEERDKPDRAGPDAEWGSAAHTVSAWGLEEKVDALAYLGRRIEVAPAKTVECTRDMCDAVQSYVDHVREATGNDTLMVEQKLDLSHIVPGGFGTADAVIIREDEIHVIDAKFGAGVGVDASYDGEPNKQMGLYALGALEAFGYLVDVKRVRMTIVQPRKNHLSEFDLPVEALVEWGLHMSEKAQRAALYLDSDTPPVASDYKPTDKGCRFCKAKAMCPALQAKVQETIGADFEDLTLGEGSFDDALTYPPQTVVNAFNLAELSTCMRAVDLIETWCKAVRAETERRLLSGDSVPGYKLVQGRRGARSWESETEAEALLKAMRLKQDEMYQFKLITPPAAEKLAKAGTIGKRQWPKLQAMITQSDGKPSVAPESDERPALVIQPIQDAFEDLTAQDLC